MGFHRGQQGHGQGHHVADRMDSATFASCFEQMDNPLQVAETTRQSNRGGGRDAVWKTRDARDADLYWCASRFHLLL